MMTRVLWIGGLAFLSAAVSGLLFSPALRSAYVPTSLGIYNASPPTLTNGEAAPLQVDIHGKLRVVQ